MWILLIPIMMCLEACYYDLQTREIPDGVSLRILISGLLVTGLSWYSLSWSDALLGVAVALLVTFPFTWTDGIGGGDLKLIGALGAWLGPIPVLGMLFWTALSGMVLALVAHLRRKPDFAYAPAIAAGIVLTACFPRGVSWLIEQIRGLQVS
jgi:Flp pilus assembly protein protease CpaA